VQKTLTFNDLSWLIVVYLFATLLKLLLKSFLDVKENYLLNKFDSYIDLQICKKLSELDPARFEDPEFQNLIAQLEGVKGSMQMQLGRFIGFVDAIFKFVTATIVVSATFPFFAPLIMFATIPSYITWERIRLKIWPYYLEKKSRLTRATQYVKIYYLAILHQRKQQSLIQGI